jgi:biotin carboxyl carrier protein
VSEGTTTRRFKVTIAPPAGVAVEVGAPGPQAPAVPGPSSGETPVYSPFDGRVQLVQVLVKEGDRVRAGQVVAAVELMKAKHDVRAPCDGRIRRIDAAVGSDVSGDTPIMLIEPEGALS